MQPHPAHKNPIHALPGPRILASQAAALTRASLAARYRRTWAGFLWVLVAPLAQFGVQLAVFHGLLNTEFGTYFAFLLSGLLPWLFLAQTLEMCAPILVNSTGLVRSLSVHPLTYVLAQVLDNLINFLLVFMLLTLGGVLAGWIPFRALLLIPLPLICLLTTVSSLGWLLATLNVFYRDTKFVLSFSLSLGFFLTPILYRPEQIPVEWLARLVRWNPVWQVIRPFQVALSHSPFSEFLEACAAAALIAMAVTALALHQWRSKKNALYFHL